MRQSDSQTSDNQTGPSGLRWAAFKIKRPPLLIKPYNRALGAKEQKTAAFGSSPPPLVPDGTTFPPLLSRATKGKRLYGQARRLTSPDLHILCRMCTVGLWVLCNVPHISTGKHRGNLPHRGRRRHRRQKGCISNGRSPVLRFSFRPLGRL